MNHDNDRRKHVVDYLSKRYLSIEPGSFPSFDDIYRTVHAWNADNPKLFQHILEPDSDPLRSGIMPAYQKESTHVAMSRPPCKDVLEPTDQHLMNTTVDLPCFKPKDALDPNSTMLQQPGYEKLTIREIQERRGSKLPAEPKAREPITFPTVTALNIQRCQEQPDNDDVHSNQTYYRIDKVAGPASGLAGAKHKKQEDTDPNEDSFYSTSDANTKSELQEAPYYPNVKLNSYSDKVAQTVPSPDIPSSATCTISEEPTQNQPQRRYFEGCQLKSSSHHVPCLSCLQLDRDCIVGSDIKAGCIICISKKQTCSFSLRPAIFRKVHDPISPLGRSIPFISMYFGGDAPPLRAEESSR